MGLNRGGVLSAGLALSPEARFYRDWGLFEWFCLLPSFMF